MAFLKAEGQLDQETKWDRLTKEELLLRALAWGLSDLFLLSKILVSQVGKEEATRLIEQARYDLYYKRARHEAEALGNPQDLDSYLENMLDKQNHQPLGDAIKFAERTKNKAVFGVTHCIIADAWKKIAEDPKEVAKYGADAIEVAKAHCVMDTAYANGFNPKMKFKRTKFILDGDNVCEFAAEV